MAEGRPARLLPAESPARKPWREEPEEGLPSYYITLSDMMTLLFSFFVALLAFLSWGDEAQRAAAASIRSALPVLTGGAAEDGAAPRGSPGGALPAHTPGTPGAPGPAAPSGAGAGAPRAPGGPSAGEPQPVPGGGKGLVEEVRRRLGALAAGGVEVLPQQEGVLIRVSSNLLVPSGSDKLLPGGRELLQGIAAVVRDLPGLVRVEGHTDNVPIHTPQFPSNWELSAARAVRVVRILTEEEGVDPRRAFFAGYGEYRPVVANVSDANRQRIRRVEISLLSGRP